MNDEENNEDENSFDDDEEEGEQEDQIKIWQKNNQNIGMEIEYTTERKQNQTGRLNSRTRNYDNSEEDSEDETNKQNKLKDLLLRMKEGKERVNS